MVGEYLRKQPNFPTLHRHKDKQGRLPEIHGKKGTSTSTTTLATTASSTSEVWTLPLPYVKGGGEEGYVETLEVCCVSLLGLRTSFLIVYINCQSCDFRYCKKSYYCFYYVFPRTTNPPTPSFPTKIEIIIYTFALHNTKSIYPFCFLSIFKMLGCPFSAWHLIGCVWI